MRQQKRIKPFIIALGAVGVVVAVYLALSQGQSHQHLSSIGLAINNHSVNSRTNNPA